MKSPVGVLAIQGDFDKHVDAFQRTGLPPDQIRLVKTPVQLDQIQRLVIPGGESTTVGLLLQRYGLGQAIQDRARQGMPVWGTCMGLILLANDLEQPQSVAGAPQYTLRLLDITVRRNAFGPQIHSFETLVPVQGLEEPLEAVFIRAPVVTRLGPSVEPLSVLDGQTVAVKSGVVLGTAFHPELTPDTRLHQLFLDL